MKKTFKQIKQALSEEQQLHLETIEHLENEVCKGNISNAEFDASMEQLKYQFKD
jgi:hypothetical protein